MINFLLGDTDGTLPQYGQGRTDGVRRVEDIFARLLVELMFKIEDRYGISIKNDTPNNLTTLDDVVAYIDGLLARRPGSAAAPGSAQPPILGSKA